MLTPPLFQRPGNGNDNDAGPPPSFRDLGTATMTMLGPPLFQRPGDGDNNLVFSRCRWISYCNNCNNDAGPSPLSKILGRRWCWHWLLPSFRVLGMATMLTLAPPLFQRCRDGDDNDAGPLLPSFRDLGLATMTMLAPSLPTPTLPCGKQYKSICDCAVPHLECRWWPIRFCVGLDWDMSCWWRRWLCINTASRLCINIVMHSYDDANAWL